MFTSKCANTYIITNCNNLFKGKVKGAPEAYSGELEHNTGKTPFGK